jgi:hypothetical protein
MIKNIIFLHGYELEVYPKLEPLTLDDYEKFCVGLCNRTENHFGSFLSVLWDLSQMDVPTRQSYIVAVVNENERTAVAGITNISRNIAQAVSPSIAG